MCNGFNVTHWRDWPYWSYLTTTFSILELTAVLGTIPGCGGMAARLMGAEPEQPPTKANRLRDLSGLTLRTQMRGFCRPLLSYLRKLFPLTKLQRRKLRIK